MREALDHKTDIALVAPNDTQRTLMETIYHRKKVTDALFLNTVPQIVTDEDIDACLPLQTAIYSSVSSDVKEKRLEHLANKGQIEQLVVLKTSQDGDYDANLIYEIVNKQL